MQRNKSVIPLLLQVAAAGLSRLTYRTGFDISLPTYSILQESAVNDRALLLSKSRKWFILSPQVQVWSHSQVVKCLKNGLVRFSNSLVLGHFKTSPDHLIKNIGDPKMPKWSMLVDLKVRISEVQFTF